MNYIEMKDELLDNCVTNEEAEAIKAMSNEEIEAVFLGKKFIDSDRFRFDHAYDTVYEYSVEQKAYLACGKLLGRTEEEFINDYDLEEEA